MSRSPGEYQAQAPAAGQRTTVRPRRPAHLYRVLRTCSVIKGLHSCPTFMYNWLRPVSCGQAGPTVSRPTRGLGRQPECWTTPSPASRANLNPLHQVLLTFVYNSSYYYIGVHIQVILHALHCLTRGPAHHCLHSFTPSTCGVT